MAPGSKLDSGLISISKNKINKTHHQHTNTTQLLRKQHRKQHKHNNTSISTNNSDQPRPHSLRCVRAHLCPPCPPGHVAMWPCSCRNSPYSTRRVSRKALVMGQRGFPSPPPPPSAIRLRLLLYRHDE